MHPYFDNFDDAKWLGARVRYTAGVVIEFYVEHVPSWPSVRQARAERHFSLLGLAALFSTQAGGELINLKYRLENLHAEGGPSLIRDQLIEDAASRRHAFRNSWQTAMYEAIATDTHFHSNGFLRI
jgi:hypothetical protein